MDRVYKTKDGHVYTTRTAAVEAEAIGYLVDHHEIERGAAHTLVMEYTTTEDAILWAEAEVKAYNLVEVSDAD